MPYLDRLLKLKSWQIWLSFVLLAIAVYHKALGNFFVSDDFHWLVIARDTELSGRIFLTNYAGDNVGGSYNPLLVVIFKFFYSLFGLKYFGYHLVSIVVHATNAWLVYLLSRRIFFLAKFSNIKLWSWLAGILFLVWPIQVEVVSWIAAWPHLWVGIFYFWSLLKYFDFRNSGKDSQLYWSALFFIIALLIKEIAISLPFVIMTAEIYFSSVNKSSKGLKSYLYLPSYFFLLVLFFITRFLTTGLLFGYYGSHTLQISASNWIGNLAAYLGDLVSFGFIRALMYKAIYYYSGPIMIILFVTLALYFFILLMKKQWLQFTMFAGFLFILAPMLVTGLHHLTFAGERYMYLPSGLFVIWILFLFSNFEWPKKIKLIILVIFLILSGVIICYKSLIWKEAGGLSKQIVDSYQELDVQPEYTFLSVGLPDNLSGAEVFRNNLGQALELYYPTNHPVILPTYAYLQLNKENKNDNLLKWRRDNVGWFAESVDGSFVVTGITSIEVNDVYWELWGYNYQNYTANIIRFMPNDAMMQRIDDGQVGILTFDRGVLKVVD